MAAALLPRKVPWDEYTIFLGTVRNMHAQNCSAMLTMLSSVAFAKMDCWVLIMNWLALLAPRPFVC